MITDELFSREFESFHFKEIHRNPPKSLLKPPAGLFGSLSGALAGSHTIFRNLRPAIQICMLNWKRNWRSVSPTFTII